MRHWVFWPLFIVLAIPSIFMVSDRITARTKIQNWDPDNRIVYVATEDDVTIVEVDSQLFVMNDQGGIYPLDCK